MRLPDPSHLASLLAARMRACAAPARGRGPRVFGRVTEIGPTLVRASLPGAGLAELCRLLPSGVEAEVVALAGHSALLSPFAEPTGMRVGSLVEPLGKPHEVAVGPFLLGKVIDGLGRPLDGKAPPSHCEWRGLERAAPDPLTRPVIDTPLPLGVRAIDGLLTCGRGQRIGIFAAAGGGKSTLLSMICDGSTNADVIVLALIGERGREVREFLEHTLSAAARKRSVVVVSTSDRPALERLKAAYTATTIAEHFRDQGMDVLLMMDSLTRFARASREIGLAAGEKPAAGSYPPSFFARLPKLLERAGPAAKGSITGIYTVLVEGDNLNEPVADEVRSILDGHIVLSRKLAEGDHYPAIDVGASVSRVMSQVAGAEQVRLAGRLRRLMASYREIELLVRVGEYQAGHDPEADEALARKDAIRAFLCQPVREINDFDDTLSMLWKTVNGPL
ncbi:EscN/YscN/HrcN family type III secretion system ATPase [Trinickia caryophylli]|uniref:protein-secreting ATPase n=1 Tax=Trinickia caryophylli TaxID=28094 RepID=A0A1X7EX87_TRICW|nr:EscN/YscN/HrcN family type III secretion system ATPase [Trinickia caryophylli]PMS09695.1 EscN/YscN/HrcN family type III secretion system ATPase [Trinickia caryophylli]TRX20282.1 EscN/YscN/HrcN family type III secretion system ATPase [Trinickia caryophylli]GLU33122.1 type III secretion system ATPase [Trinickia caryophylli]SMF41350.1 ATP synthase in type III secretion protein N [Trinickia caryophylli]